MAKEIKCNVGKGSFFINSYKNEEQHPDYKGSININGTPEELALWIRKEENSDNVFLRCVCMTTKVTFVIKPAKKEDEKKPDYRGFFEYEGKKYDVGGWMNTTQSGVQYCSLSVKESQSSGKPASAPTGFPTFGNTAVNTQSPYPTAAQPQAPAVNQPSDNEEIDQVPF